MQLALQSFDYTVKYGLQDFDCGTDYLRMIHLTLCRNSRILKSAYKLGAKCFNLLTCLVPITFG